MRTYQSRRVTLVVEIREDISYKETYYYIQRDLLMYVQRPVCLELDDKKRQKWVGGV